MSLEAETRAILEAAGAEKIKVSQDALGFVVAATFAGEGFDGQPHAGHTGIDPNTSPDPRDLARRLIEISRREHDRRAGVKPEPEPQRDAWEEPATTLTEETTFAPENDPFGPLPDPPSLGADILAAEAEAGESAGDEQDHAFSVRDLTQTDPDLRVEGSDGVEGGAAGLGEHEGSEDDRHVVGDDMGDGGAPIDADFTEFGDLPAIEGQDVTEATDDPVNTGSEPPQDRFYGLDDLDRRRSLRIGDVVRIALEKMPPWDAQDDAALALERNFAMGVAEQRWPDDDRHRVLLQALEGKLSKKRLIETERDAKVAFLTAASREEIEAFDPEADWPE